MRAQAIRPSSPEEILQEAATWLMEMHEGPLPPAERARFNQWRQRSTEHEQAWQKAAMLLEKFQGVPAPGVIALKNATPTSRRAAIKTLAVLLAVGPSAWVAYRYSPWSGPADVIATARGERRELALEDGTHLTLNTATRVQIRYDDNARHVHLLDGEILVATAKDSRQPARPFIVQTAEGRLRPLGTRFTVRQLDASSHLAVYEGAVEIMPAAAPQARQTIAAGYQAGFSPLDIEPATPNNVLDLSWQNGMLVTDRMPLSAFAAELGRYRPGLLQVDPAVAGLPVSGVFPLADTGASLTLLAQTMPLRVQYFTRYWVRIGVR